MAHVRWLHLTKATLDKAEDACRERHESAVPGCALSVCSNVAGTEFLVKVVEADREWRAEQDWMGEAIRVFDRDDHGEALAMVDGPGWRAE